MRNGHSTPGVYCSEIGFRRNRRFLPKKGHCLFPINSLKTGTEELKCITFEDSEVERICIENFSSNGICLTYEDAERIESLNLVFQGNETIRNFGELKYFTNLKRFDNYEFKNCINLQKISLGENFRTFYYGCFDGCRHLERLEINSCQPPGITSKTVTDANWYTTYEPFTPLMVGRRIGVYVPTGCKREYRGRSAYNGADVYEMDFE